MHARPFKTLFIWCALGGAVCVPIALAFTSPLLAWRDLIYIVAGFSGVFALALLLLQPLLAIGALPSLHAVTARRVHRFIGVALVLLILLHVAGLWITSPPDVIDALTFRSPTPFSLWGVIAMWAVFGTALLALLRRRLRIRPRVWKLAHSCFAGVIVAGTILHALLIDGTMEVISKALLCICLGGATVFALGKTLRKS